jgi:hypothetical protein
MSSVFVKVSGDTVVYPYTQQQLRSDHPDTSFPVSVSTQGAPEFGVFLVVQAETPAYDPSSQRIETAPAPVLIGDVWTLTKTVEQQTPEQIAANAANKAAQVRSERNKKLTATDWTQLADSTADKAAWATHRQALRDITAQAGFPWTIDWPTQP